MLLVASMSGLPAVGVGAMGRPDESILAVARRFVRHAGSSEPVLLALATGRVVSRELRIPRLNTSLRFWSEAAPTAPTGWTAPAAASAAASAGGFCGFCGAARTSSHTYCTKCGKPYQA